MDPVAFDDHVTPWRSSVLFCILIFIVCRCVIIQHRLVPRRNEAEGATGVSNATFEIELTFVKNLIRGLDKAFAGEECMFFVGLCVYAVAFVPLPGPCRKWVADWDL